MKELFQCLLEKYYGKREIDCWKNYFYTYLQTHGEIGCFDQFLLIVQYFQKASKVIHIRERVSQSVIEMQCLQKHHCSYSNICPFLKATNSNVALRHFYVMMPYRTLFSQFTRKLLNNCEFKDNRLVST